MIFIFDWGHTTERRPGPLSRRDADYRLDSEFVWLSRVREWFRAFFIPVIPTRTVYYFVSDADGSLEEIDRSTFEHYRPLAELNAKSMNEEISQAEYERRRREMGFA